ncbi:hypothetical protein [Xanthomonas citri]|uniref:hypothetical protein n=1 Tax=Xanthomonas citri TaxID=346 RepID=UPI0002DA39F0|nr:hypothetical protein [Xanthomonas citri]AMV00299.1 hypothetical protein TP37_21075 [Xanthomonas citri pv. aurantifolii]AMV04615.1 hypothetical protein TP50_20870 [Xanthomonas citri pv. aurantifolii]MCC8491350.1 hypothetical protein [Xanthomonas citri pv. fuscans]TBW97615.1 hypothetical protein TP47_10710 [Xanthomonas citri pv. aurantifolii]TBW99021.1 hypothetical protein TP49_05575 [Xanthomonas citri pv. aurantifolii]
MADHARFLVVPAEWVAGQGFADEEEAIGMAVLKTRNDRKHRAIVRVVARIEPDPLPTTVVTRFEDTTGGQEGIA